jgi:hypothetical protein
MVVGRPARGSNFQTSAPAQRQIRSLPDVLSGAETIAHRRGVADMNSDRNVADRNLHVARRQQNVK